MEQNAKRDADADKGGRNRPLAVRGSPVGEGRKSAHMSRGPSARARRPRHSAEGWSRREFINAAVAAAAGLVAHGLATAEEKKDQDLEIAFIGVGSQGRNLLVNCLKIPGIRIRAICDIWPYHQKYAAGILKAYNQQAGIYDDYRELLAKEKNLAAAIIATPDWVHAEQTNEALRAGLHVYCEKEMSHTLEGASGMVATARKTGKLLQIGHQRRSSPRYWLGLKLIEKERLVGRITHAYGQWNRRQGLDLGWAKGVEMDEATLRRYGYEDMDQFRNWRWFRKFSGGPLADLGSHQIDVFSWFLKADPVSVQASGGIDYYRGKGRDWYDNMMAIYEYDTTQVSSAGEQTPQRVRAFYQVLNSTSHGGYYEAFMGDEGSIVISEDINKGFFFREPTSTARRQWEDEAKKVSAMDREAIQIKVGETLTAQGTKDPKAEKLLADVQKPVHQLHLENFFAAVRANKKELLSCPAETAYRTAVAVLMANDAVAQKRQIEFRPGQFSVGL